MTNVQRQSGPPRICRTALVFALLALAPLAAIVPAGGPLLAQEQFTDQPAASPPPAERRPGFMESFGRWMDDSAASMSRNIENFWRGAANQSGAATRASTEATANIAKGALDAAKGTADALGKFGGARVITGRERCAIAANGAPDCRVAAETLCKSKGFNGGSSVDYETSESCPLQARLGRKDPAECRVEHVVTKAVCQ